jgi:hypothetical protein
MNIYPSVDTVCHGLWFLCSYHDFIDRWLLLTVELLNQGLPVVTLKSSLRYYFLEYPLTVLRVTFYWRKLLVDFLFVFVCLCHSSTQFPNDIMFKWLISNSSGVINEAETPHLSKESEFSLRFSLACVTQSYLNLVSLFLLVINL